MMTLIAKKRIRTGKYTVAFTQTVRETKICIDEAFIYRDRSKKGGLRFRLLFLLRD